MFDKITDKLYSSNSHKKSLQKVESFERKRLEEIGAAVSDQSKYNTHIEKEARSTTWSKVIGLVFVVIVILFIFFHDSNTIFFGKKLEYNQCQTALNTWSNYDWVEKCQCVYDSSGWDGFCIKK